MEYLESFATSRIPGFVKEDNPGFVEFMKAYYTWLTQSKVDVKTAIDIDKTTDEFMIHFTSQYLYVIPNELVTDKKNFIKHARSFFGSKGTEESIRLLFRCIYGEEATIEYTANKVLKPSDGRWFRQTSIKVTTDFVNQINDVAGKYIYGSNSQSAQIERITSYYANSILYHEIFLSKIVGEFVNNTTVLIDVPNGVVNAYFVVGSDKITVSSTEGMVVGQTVSTPEFPFGTVITSIISATQIQVDNNATKTNEGTTIRIGIPATVVPVCSSFDLGDGGQYYIPGDVGSLTGGSGTGLYVEVHEVHDGKIESISVINGGSGYTVGDIITDATPGSTSLFKAMVATIDGSGTILTCRVLNNQTLYNRRPTLQITSPYGSGATVVAQGPYIGKVRTVNVISFGQAYSTPPLIEIQHSQTTYVGDGVAVGSGIVGGMCRYVGRYQSESSMVSSSMKIENDGMYQPYAYVVRSTQLVSKYRDLLKEAVHPAGMIMFGETAIFNTANIGLFGGIQNAINTIDASGRPIYRDILRFLFAQAQATNPTASTSDSILVVLDELFAQPLHLDRALLDEWKFRALYTRNITYFMNDTIRSWVSDGLINPDAGDPMFVAPDAEHFRLDGSLNVIYPRF